MYRFASLPEVQVHWQELLQHRAFRALPEAKILLQILNTQTFQVLHPKGQLPLSWFVDIRAGTLALNGAEFASLARMFSIYADFSRNLLQRLGEDSGFVYWSGGWGDWMWDRIFALKLLPGLLYASSRLRFRREIAQRLGWSYPLESWEELLAGMIVQARSIQLIEQDPELQHLWQLVRFGRVDRPYQILMKYWNQQHVAGLNQWIHVFTKQPLGVLSPIYGLYPLKDIFQISLSSKRPPFRLNRPRTDSFLLDSKQGLQKKIQQEYRMIRDYLRFIEEKVPVRIEEIVVKRLSRMGIDQAEPRALWFRRLWQHQLMEHYQTNLMVETFQKKQQRNRLALNLLANSKLFLKLKQAYQDVLNLWLQTYAKTVPPSKTP